MKNIYWLISVCAVLFSCGYENTSDCHQIVTFVNKTNKHLYLRTSFDNREEDEIKYHPDPLYNSQKSKVEASAVSTLSMKSCF